MPNWFYFTVSVSGKEQDVQEFVENVKGKKEFETEGREFDFNHFIPQPENIFRENIGSDKRKELDAIGVPNWYDWNNENWGTKWNANVENEYGEGNNYHTYDMATAWAFPDPVIKAMIKKYPHLVFDISGEEESGMYGVFIDTENNVWLEEEPRLIDEYNGKEVYHNDGIWKYEDDGTEVPDQDDFWPVNKYSWS